MQWVNSSKKNCVSPFRFLLVLLCLGLLATPALADDHGDEKVKTVSLKLMVSHLCQKPGEIDPAAAELHQQLREDFRYTSLRVLQSETFVVPLREVVQLTLPTGKFVRVQPIALNRHGLLMIVEVEGMLQTDLQVKNEHQVVIGAQRYQEGKLVITVQPSFKPQH